VASSFEEINHQRDNLMNPSFKTKAVENVHFDYKWLLYFVFLYPFIIFPGGLFDKPKVIDEAVIFAVVENYWLLPKVAVLSFFAILGTLKTYRLWQKSAFLSLIVVHVSLAVISSLNSQDEITWILLGPQRRLDGLIYHISLSLIAVSSYYTFKNSRNKIYCDFLRFLIAGGVIQSLIIGLQLYKIDVVGALTYVQPINVPAGTMTHPGVLAAWLVCIIMLGLILLLEKPKDIFLICGLFIVAMGLGFTKNQTAVYSLIFFSVVWSFIHRKRYFILCNLLIFSGILIGPALLPGVQGFSRDPLETRTLKTRVQIWNLAWGATGNIPFFPFIGGGTDAFRLSLLRNPPGQAYLDLEALESDWKNYEIKGFKFVKDEPLRISEYEVEFSKFDGKGGVVPGAPVILSIPVFLDRAHNFFLDRLLSFGIFSVLTWFLLYFYPTFVYMKEFISKKWVFDYRNTGISIALIALSTYYLVWFPALQAEPLHVIFIAIAWSNLVFIKSSVSTFRQEDAEHSPSN
jgi:hypothetical protein